MKTRSSTGNANEDDRETDTDESSLTNSSSRRRKLAKRVSNHLHKYNMRLGQGLKREHESCSRDTDQKSSAASNSNDMFANGDDGPSVRRSTRQRKFTYDNLNQAWLLAAPVPDHFAGLFSGEPGDPTVRRSSRRHTHPNAMRMGLAPDGLEFEDMYSRVKRKRRKTVHSFYSRRLSRDAGSMADTEDTDQNGISDSDTIEDRSDLEGAPAQFPSEINDESQEGLGVHGPKYSLRPKKPITERFQFPIVPTRPRRSAAATIFEAAARHHTRPRERESFKSTAHRSHLFRRKRHAIHNSSSSSSSDDERRFEKRKALSMARARNRCLPMNFLEDDLSKGVLRDRMKIGSSLADIDPMSIDKNVSFEHVGGLDKHIRSLKEMILFPLMYPEVFQKFKISPPRGVLFYGQPGTGKTLVARALANECSTGDRRVAFFMRKGADCLSKWVGESERQLRLLFDQAYSMRPSIIFFDEMDGLAPVRSTRQDQIHSSIVSTLLALMDGLDNRGEVIIIGATNRLDAIDPALRRPGRFDRELLFPLPSIQARVKILEITTREWVPPLDTGLLNELAVTTAGYCGADLRALCSEAALVALRRRYPQIYSSKDKLQLDVDTIQVESIDFVNALKKMKPSVQRCSVVSSKPLSSVVTPLLEPMLLSAVGRISKIFPFFTVSAKNFCDQSKSPSRNPAMRVECEDSDSCLYLEDAPKPNSACASPRSKMKIADIKSQLTGLSPAVHRPHFLVCGGSGQGQDALAAAALHRMERVTVHRLDLPALYGVSTRAPEEACAQVFHEAQRNVPSVIFLPHIGVWWETLSETLRATFLCLMQDLDPSLPLLLLATSDISYYQLPLKIQELFSGCSEQLFSMRNPTLEERKSFFSGLAKEIFKLPHPPPQKVVPVEIPVAPPPDMRVLTAVELGKVRQREEATLRELRLFLRDILNKLAKDRRFYIFSRPVDPDEVPDYEEVIRCPMDLETMMTKIDQNGYETVGQFLSDIDLICQNALEYNPDRDPSDKIIRHRACTLKDVAHALVDTELDAEFEKICQDIVVARKERGEAPAKFLPKKSPQISREPLAAANNAAPAAEFKRADVATESKEKPEKKEASDILSPTRFSQRIRKIGFASPKTRKGSPNNRMKTFSPPARTVRYMIWRKRKKSPWFGGCKQKLIRRRIKTAAPKRVAAKNANFSPNSKFVKISDPVQPSVIAEDESVDVKPHVHVVEDRKEMSGTDSSATVVSPKPASLVLDGLDKADCPEESSPARSSPLRRQAPSDLSLDFHCSRSGLLRSPPASGLRRSPKVNSSPLVPQLRKTASSPMETESVPIPSSSQKSCESPRRRVMIDTVALDGFISRLVRVTEDHTVERLLQLYSTLQRCIYAHRRDTDKRELLKELEKTLDCHLRYKPS